MLITAWIDSLRARTRGLRRAFLERRRTASLNVRPQVEALEDRQLLSDVPVAQLALNGENAPVVHFLQAPDTGGMYRWRDQDPTTPNVIDIRYDFRSLNGYLNQITPVEEQAAVQAMHLWESATGGAIHFIQSTTVATANVITIGIGDLAAVGDPSGPGSIIGEGGASLIHASSNSLASGFAWLNGSNTWSTTTAALPPTGTRDFFSVVAHEIGHAIGLGHDDDLAGTNIMNSIYGGQKLQAGAGDTQLVQQLYPLTTSSPSSTQSSPPSTAQANLTTGGPILVVGADAGQPPLVKVFDESSGTLKFQFLAYDSSFLGGVRVAVGDFNGDGAPDIVVSPGPGGGPHVRVFDGLTGARLGGWLGGFFAYAPTFNQGLNIAVGDVNGDGVPDLITGADAGGGPHVKVFNGKDGSVLRSFFAYDPSFSGGVRVAVGDVTGDGKADVVTAPGVGGGPDVRVFDGATGALIRDFLAYDGRVNTGFYVAVGDVNGDGHADVITGTGPGAGPHVKVFSGTDNTLLASFFAFDANFIGGVRVGTVDLHGHAEVITVAGPGGGPHVKIWDAPSMTQLDSFFAYGADFASGLFAAGARA